MSLLVIGADGAVTRALGSAAPLAGVDEAARAIQEQRPEAVAVVALPAPAGPAGVDRTANERSTPCAHIS